MFSTPKRTDAPSYYSGEGSAEPASGSKTVIARGVKVEGDFTSQGDVVIEGEVHGKISTTGILTVGSEAVIKADVTADEVVISGTIEGNLHVKKQAMLHASARVKGDLMVERATIESGASLDGRVQIGQPAPLTARANNRATSKTVPAAAASPVELTASAE